jgi:hypothetical protein
MTRARSLTGLGLFAAALVTSAAARAQEPPSSGGPLPPLPPPPQVTPEYAPAPAPPPPPPPAPPRGAPAPGYFPRGVATGGLAEIRYEPTEPDVALLQRSGGAWVSGVTRFRHTWWYEARVTPLFSPICEGPCDVRVAPGTYRLALAKPGRGAVPAGPVTLAGPATIRAEYVDRSGARTAGTVIGIVGVLGGIALVVASFETGDTVCDDYGYCTTRANGPMLAGGIIAIVGSAIVGSVLALQHDEARISVEPLRTGAAPRSAAPDVASIAPARAEGAALTMRF